ncbi:Fur family transcriptional regulator [Clostridium ihumii]|uniref:Fur family transcriptional regulator n=1 Tax=Clostridium ihumii TaxID=1470356 RepID=UPI00058C3276|nr:Fur family transcriptional regulator [Clostridium ihumii]
MSHEKIEELKDELKEKGYKLTPQRRAILNGIINSEGEHLTAEELYDLVKADCPEIGLATVYRTVQLLEELGVICRLDLDDGISRYELSQGDDNHNHHHLICTKCNKVIEVQGDLLEEIEKVIEEKYKFKIENHSLKFYGFCDECNESK